MGFSSDILAKVKIALKDMCKKGTKLYAVGSDGQPEEDVYLEIHAAPNQEGVGAFRHVNLRTQQDIIFYRVEADGSITGWFPGDDTFPITVSLDECNYAAPEIYLLTCE